jgi:hypothetical protein
MRAVWVLGLTVLAGFAGCIGSGSAPLAGVDLEADASAAFGPIAALLADVPCEASVVSLTGTSENLKLLSSVPRADEDVRGAEIDLRDGLAVVSTYGRRGFELVDAADPLGMTVLSTYSHGRGTSLDVKVTKDRSTVFMGVPQGIDIVDIRDREAPRLIGTWDFPSRGTAVQPLHPSQNAHMLYLYDVANVTYLFIAGNDNTGVYILRVEGEPGAHWLSYVSNAAGFPNGPLGPHDLWAHYDERAKGHIVYVANGFMGWLAYNITNPGSPQRVAAMVNPDTHQGYIHTIQAQWVGDRRLVALVSEVGVNAMRVFDATDFGRPIYLGSWTYDNRNPTLLQHNLQIVNGTLYFAHYGQGVFAFDLTTVTTMPLGQVQQLRPVAHYAVGEGDSVWDIVVKDGLLYVGNNVDLRVVGYGCLVPGDAALTSTG